MQSRRKGLEFIKRSGMNLMLGWLGLNIALGLWLTSKIVFWPVFMLMWSKRIRHDWEWLWILGVSVMVDEVLGFRWGVSWLMGLEFIGISWLKEKRIKKGWQLLGIILVGGLIYWVEKEWWLMLEPRNLLVNVGVWVLGWWLVRKI